MNEGFRSSLWARSGLKSGPMCQIQPAGLVQCGCCMKPRKCLAPHTLAPTPCTASSMWHQSWVSPACVTHTELTLCPGLPWKANLAQLPKAAWAQDQSHAVCRPHMQHCRPDGASLRARFILQVVRLTPLI